MSGAQRGVELGYVETQTGVTVTASTTDVAGMTIAIVAGVRPFILVAEALAQIGLGTGAAGGDSQLGMYIAESDGTIRAVGYFKTKVPAAGNVQSVIRAFRRISLPVGTAKTYKLQTQAVTIPTNTAQSLQAGPASAAAGLGPITLHAIEV